MKASLWVVVLCLTVLVINPQSWTGLAAAEKVDDAWSKQIAHPAGREASRGGRQRGIRRSFMEPSSSCPFEGDTARSNLSR